MKNQLNSSDFPTLTYMLETHLFGDSYEEEIKDFVKVESQKSVKALNELNELLRYERRLVMQYLAGVHCLYFINPRMREFDESTHGEENLTILRSMRGDLIKYIKSSEQ